MSGRMLAAAIGAGRVLFGLALLASPRSLGRSWIGPAAETAGGTAAVRAVGARDLVLGLGVLLAARRGAPLRGWVEAGVAADSADVAITLAGFGGLPPMGRLVTLATAGASAIVGGIVARSLDEPPVAAPPAGLDA